MVELTQVTKTYLEGSSRHVVLDHLDMHISSGEIVILYGKSGSGKSTLLNITSGIDTPDEGSVFLDGTDITRLTERDRTLVRRRRIGFIFQFFNLVPTLTVEENLRLPLELNGILNQDDLIGSILSEIGLPGKSSAYPDKLSGGEQQRVAIARALIHNPDIILADEPTGNLDYETGLQIVDLLDRVVKRKNKTMIMVTHSEEVIGLADTILHLRDGRLVAMHEGPVRA